MRNARFAWRGRLALALLVLAGCATHAEAPASSTDDDEAAINAVYARFSKAYDEGDGQAVSDLYTDDALYLSGGDGAIRRGRAAIEQTFSFLDRVKARGETISISFRFADRAIEGDLAYDVGYYRTVSTPADGEPRASVGKFVTVLKKQADGSWRFQVDGYSGAPVEAFDALAEE